ncbi:MAG: hypothetical protein WC552_09360 [Candidatus Omnitrophota bacterium]
MKKSFFVMVLAALNLLAGLVFSAGPLTAGGEEVSLVGLPGVSEGITREELFALYPQKEERTYRKQGEEDWVTFNDPRENRPSGIVTFHLKENKVAGWIFNDREEVVREYLGEFCSQGIIKYFPKIYSAISHVLNKLPDDIFLDVTDRTRPVLFTEYYDSGGAKFANSSQIVVFPDDPPTFTEGIWIMKLSTALNISDSFEAIAGVVIHELAHRILGHGDSAAYSPIMEKEANDLVRKLGFAEELRRAQDIFKGE